MTPFVARYVLADMKDPVTCLAYSGGGDGGQPVLCIGDEEGHVFVLHFLKHTQWLFKKVGVEDVQHIYWRVKLFTTYRSIESDERNLVTLTNMTLPLKFELLTPFYRFYQSRRRQVQISKKNFAGNVICYIFITLDFILRFLCDQFISFMFSIL